MLIHIASVHQPNMYTITSEIAQRTIKHHNMYL